MTRDLKDSELYEGCYRLKERRSNVRFYALIFAFVLCLFGFRYYWTSTFGGVKVDGESMYSTLVDGEELLIRYVKNGEGIERGDIVVVHVEDYPELQEYNSRRPENQKVKYLIKRLIAVEGDTVKCTAGQIQIKYAGETEFVDLNEPYAYYSKDKADYHFAEYIVGKGEIFFLGDNRFHSVDSRWQENNADFVGSHLKSDLYKATDVFGVVPEWAIKGQSIFEKIFF